VTVTSPTGSGLEYSLDGSTYQTGITFTGVANGNHIIAVRNAAGCTTIGTIFSVTCGCINPPAVTLSSISGSTCVTSAVTVSGNTFGGSATSVSITGNGSGSLSPSSASSSPFTLIYTPAAGDAGKTVLITVTTNNPLGGACVAAIATYTLTVNAIPTAPTAGTFTYPTCSVSTGSVVLNGLPASGTWTLTRSPDAVITNGTGTSTTVTGLASGTYTFTVTSAAGCISVSSANVVINAQPATPTAPGVGTITQPTCVLSTGSVALSGLPSTGTWTVTRTPGSVTTTGTGSETTISEIPAGTYTFTMTNASGCISPSSGNVIINVQPGMPAAPSIGTITPPTCSLSSGSVVLFGLPSTGTWTLTRYTGGETTIGTGTSTTITGLSATTYNYTVTNAAGCISVLSVNVIIPVQPATPSAPVVGTITQPTLGVPTGSVVLSGLPSSGTWTLTRSPGEVTTIGTGASKTITGLPAGVFTFTVTSSAGCTSTASTEVIISTPGVPVLIITNPAAVCSPATVNLTAGGVIAGSTPGLTYTYWTDAGATIAYTTPSAATAGTYYIKGTTVSGYFDIKPVIVTVDQMPVANAGPDQVLEYVFGTTLDAQPVEEGSGVWSLVSSTAEFFDNTDPKTAVSGLSIGDNILKWTVTNGVCPASSDNVTITVHDLIIPTLITPNMDGRNDYFVLRGISTLGKTQLTIFDRNGTRVYNNPDYDNTWDGVDYNSNPLPDDTYFYVIKSENGKSLSGFIVIRR
jgi:gliding motility-associated-like protein